MTSTEELCAMLDERGIEYEVNDQGWVFFSVNGFGWMFVPSDTHGQLMHQQLLITPEQAIAATVGSGTCKNVCASVSEFTCSECGFNCDLTSWISLFDGDSGRHRHHHHGTPNYCPNCGRKVRA